MEPLLYDKQQAADLLGCSVDMVDRLRKLGKLRSIYLSANPGSSRHKGIRFDRQALLDCIEACRENPSRTWGEPQTTDLDAAMARGEAALGKGRPSRSSSRA